MRRHIAYILLVIAMGHQACAQGDSRLFLNPGLKVGYVSGPGGGFIFGFEVSLTKNVYGGFVGIVADLDFCGDRTKLHVGAQGSLIAGVEIGPTWTWENGTRELGLGFTVFAGVVGYLYYTYTSMPKDKQNEYGLYLKYHTMVAQ